MKETTVNDPRSRGFSAALGSASSGRLEFVRGAANVTLRVDPSLEDLYRARFDGPLPEVHAQDGGETRLQTPDYEGATDRYDVEVSGGASKLTVDVRRETISP